MDGSRAFEYLRRMSEDERKSVRLVWLDKEMLESLVDEDVESKMTWFTNLTGEEQGEIIEKALYTEGGDYTKAMDEFLDDFVARLGKAIAEKMGK